MMTFVVLKWTHLNVGSCSGRIIPGALPLASSPPAGTIRGMTVANALTVLRGLLAVPTVIAVLRSQWGAALALFLGALATDVLDGWIARRTHQVTVVGQLLDPVVDKAFYLSLFSSLAAVGRIPPVGAGLFVLPQVGLGVGALVLWRRRREFVAEWPGKAAAVLSALAAGLLLLTPHGIWAFWVAVGGQFMAGAYYLARRATGRTPVGDPLRTPPKPR